MAQEGPYFDDEDLIDDYVEESFDHEAPTLPNDENNEWNMMEPPPPSDDEDDMNKEERMTALMEPTNKNNADHVGNTLDEEDDDVLSNEMGPPTNIVLLNHPPPMNDSQRPSASNRDKELYKFERYDSKSSWRSHSSSSTMETLQWRTSKSTNVENKSRGFLPFNRQMSSMSASSSADAQLVRFCNSTAAAASRLTDGVRVRRRFLAMVGSSQNGAISYEPGDDFDRIPVTMSDGVQVYVRQRKVNKQSPTNNEMTITTNLLGLPMSELVRKANIIERKNAMRKNRRSDQANERKNSNATRNSSENNDKTSKSSLQQLWVDKHAPTRFSHLLSDEWVNREVLWALRAWDPFVFGRPPPPRPVKRNMGSNHFDKHQPNGANKSRGAAVGDNDDEEKTNDHDIRPGERSRVILLSGPPGVGKTTLAHIVSKHAGYRPLEVNASDERSAAALTERVLRAMESNTLNLSSKNATTKDNMGGRPNCLILDEIDGADAKSAISALVDIIRADAPVPGKQLLHGSKKGGRKKLRKPYLRRPIIFICNHKYAPVLRPLLPYARQFEVAPPSPMRLAARLRAVLSFEQLALSSGGYTSNGGNPLHRLLNGTGGDIRNCLHVMQFASARAKELADRKKRRSMSQNNENEVGSVVDISRQLSSVLGDGMKDQRGDIVTTVMGVFRKLKDGKDIRSKTDKSSPVKERDVDRILKAVERFGDMSKTLDCLFLNIPAVSYIDPTMDRCSAAHEWLSIADVFRSHKIPVAFSNSAEHHAMQRVHIPSAAAAVHLLCRVETTHNSTLAFSTRPMSDARYRREVNSALVRRFVDGMNPKVQRGIQGASIVTDFVPYCLWLLSAGCGSCSLNRAVSSVEILNSREKVAFQAHISTLRALGLTYVKVHDDGDDQEKLPSSNSVRLEPEIDTTVHFGGLVVDESLKRKEVPPIIKELLAFGVKVEQMKDRERTGESNSSSKLYSPSRKKKTEITSPKKQQDRQQENKLREIDICTKSRNYQKNFLGVGAMKARAAKKARKVASMNSERQKRRKQTI